MILFWILVGIYLILLAGVGMIRLLVWLVIMLVRFIAWATCSYIHRGS